MSKPSKSNPGDKLTRTEPKLTPSLRAVQSLNSGQMGRLPSFKPPRDLTLGATGKINSGGNSDASRKKFVPNLNVQRKEKRDSSKTTPKREPVSSQSTKSSVTKKKPELIQTTGAIFSEGMGLANRAHTGSGNSKTNDKCITEKPKVTFHKIEPKVDKSLDEERLLEFLKDDFIEDLKAGSDLPVQLPMQSSSKLYKEEAVSDSDEDEIRIMSKPLKKNKRSNLILDSDDDDEVTVFKAKPDITTSKHDDPSLAELIKSKASDFFFIHLPDYLPGVPTDSDFKPPLDSAAAIFPPQSSLGEVSEGFLGKLQVRASGRTQLEIGNTTLDVDLGTQVGFLQELVSMRVPPQTENFQQRRIGNMTLLGRIHHKLVITPDLSQISREVSSSDDEQ